MSTQRSIAAVVCVVAAAVALTAGLLAARSTAASSAATATPATLAKRLVGHWKGPKFGAEADRFRRDEWDLFFDRASGTALIGRKRHRESSGRWSAFERIDAVIDTARHLWGVDEDGMINGALRRNGVLELVYQEPGTSDAAAAVIRLRRVRA